MANCFLSQLMSESSKQLHNKIKPKQVFFVFFNYQTTTVMYVYQEANEYFQGQANDKFSFFL